MRVPIRYILAAIAFGVAILGFVLLPTHAHADDCHCAPPPPPPCHCEPPPACTSCSNAHAEAHANAYAVNVARAQTQDVVIRNRGGGGGFDVDVGVTSSFFAEGAAFAVTDGQTASLRAVCVDAAGVERMASQTSATRDVPGGFAGELYRCAAGLRMRYTVQGQAMECAPAQALWYSAGRLACRAQTHQARGYEQTLIARNGYADKNVILTASAENADTSFAASAAPGGVGGF